MPALSVAPDLRERVGPSIGGDSTRVGTTRTLADRPLRFAADGFFTRR